MKIKTDDILRETYKELNHISEEKINFVIKHFWKTLRESLTKPLNTKSEGIRIKGFVRFYMNPDVVKDFLGYAHKNKNEEKIEFFTKLSAHCKSYNKRQKRKLNEDIKKTEE